MGAETVSIRTLHAQKETRNKQWRSEITALRYGAKVAEALCSAVLGGGRKGVKKNSAGLQGPALVGDAALRQALQVCPARAVSPCDNPNHKWR